MKRYGVLAVAVLTLLGMLPPPALAQGTQVTIGGLIDNLTNVNDNSSQLDRTVGGLTTDGDDEWYSRTRARWFINAKKGKAKAVLGLELDLTYGQIGTNPAIPAPADANFDFNNGDRLGRFATSCSIDADFDARGCIEVKHMYVEFPLAGEGSLLPMVPYAGMARVGGQPYKVTYKPFIFASSDFGGLNMDLAITPEAKAQFVFVQHEEDSEGSVALGFERGDDIGVIFAVEVTPEKGLNIKPIYSYQNIQGTTSGLIRRGAGGIAVGDGQMRIGEDKLAENRHTLGFDARWRSGPWSMQPTFFYQFGNRERFNGTIVREADLRAWMLDLQGGYRTGPFKLEGRFVYTSGNEATDDLDDEINYYQPFQSGNAYYIGWGEAFGIGLVDYLTSLYGFTNSLSLPANAGYDRYGRIIASVKGTYSVTPALSVYGIVSPTWTAEDVDTRGTIGGNGITVSAAPAAADESYLGTDLTGGFKWRFAPGLSFDWVFGYFVAGNAYNIALTPGGLEQEADDVYVSTARVRYVF